MGIRILGCGGEYENVPFKSVGVAEVMKIQIYWDDHAKDYVVAAKLKYPDGKNRVVVARTHPHSAPSIDPHFFPDASLLARFNATDTGWRHAISFCVDVLGLSKVSNGW